MLSLSPEGRALVGTPISIEPFFNGAFGRAPLLYSQGGLSLSIAGLINIVRESSEFGTLLSQREQLIVGLMGSQKSLYIAALAKEPLEEKAFPALVLTHSRYEAEKWYRDLSTLLSPEEVVHFPTLDTFPHEEVVDDLSVSRERLRALASLSFREPRIVIASIQGVAERLIPPERFREMTMQISAGERLDLDALSESLSERGYERIERVETPGQFSVRGGIVDVYPITSDEPIRIDLFDDEVESIRHFDPSSQRSSEELAAVVIPPAREFLFGQDGVERVVAAIQETAGRQERRLRRLERDETADALLSRVAEHAEKLHQGVYFEGIEQYKPFFYPQLATLIEYVTSGIVVLDEPTRLRERCTAFLKEMAESHSALLEKGRILPSQEKIYADWADLSSLTPKDGRMYFASLDKRVPGMRPQSVVQVRARPPELFHGKFDRLVESTREWRSGRYRICLVLSTQERSERVVEALREEGLEAVFTPHVNGELKGGNVVVTTGSLQAGGEFPDAGLVVLTDFEVFGVSKRRRRRDKPSESGVRIADFGDLNEGDHVVHTNHGIGRYVGMETLEIGGVHKDYLVVKYAGDDKLYVPTEQVDLLQRYIGVESQPPKLNKLGGNEWARVKKRVKESVQEMAEGLLRLYAERETVKGYSFSPDTVWQTQFEDSFPYEETPDQARAIRDVKSDMERSRPMDRLLCGDVGYGKTEVAVRAAFKAVMDGKQVALLVPTTILAQQHGRTFEERFEGYPVKVRVLSRFQSSAEQKEIMRGVKQGIIDIVIGTHRLLSKDVTFKDLGMVIVDEEQRFGVVQKERLKEMCKEVDVLTLSATPIPRTLHMSMVGVRDMSLIETPPEDRFPIRTYVVEYDDETIREAILRELSRQGQVYFVYNQVKSIDQMRSRLMELVPEARIAVAHGQMDEDLLEEIMLDFLHGEYDVLLCSTIIETGMDISNVNTLIVNDADRLGLAQLYQLRGRVGRSNRVAYAYFTYRRDKILAEDAEKRLHAIKEFTELGSGFKIAMRDLEIRGAGNILGAEQHGFIASVGFELYCRLLDESIKELRGDVIPEPPEPVIDLNVDAYISDQYITDSQQKVEIYKKVISVTRIEDADDLAEEIKDRFGPLPQSVQSLLAVARIKAIGKECGVGSITSEGDGAMVKLLTGLSFPREIANLTREYRGRVLVAPRGAGLKVRGRGLNERDFLTLLEGVLSDVKAMTTGDADRSNAEPEKAWSSLTRARG